MHAGSRRTVFLCPFPPVQDRESSDIGHRGSEPSGPAAQNRRLTHACPVARSGRTHQPLTHQPSGSVAIYQDPACLGGEHRIFSCPPARSHRPEASRPPKHKDACTLASRMQAFNGSPWFVREPGKVEPQNYRDEYVNRVILSTSCRFLAAKPSRTFRSPISTICASVFRTMRANSSC